MSVIYTLKFVLFVTLGSALAAPKPLVIPPGDQGLEAHIYEVQRQIPFATNNTHVSGSFNDLVVALRKKFRNYDRWMKEKPGPYVIDAYKEEATLVQEMDLSEAPLRHFQGSVQNEFQKLVAEIPEQLSPTEKIKWLKEQAYKNLLASMQISSESVRGIFVGLAQLLQGPEKGEFFKLGNPSSQLKFLEQKNWTDEMLRESAFRPEQVGLTKETVSVEKVFAIVRSRLTRSTQMMTWLSFLKVVGKLRATDFTENGLLFLSADSFSMKLQAGDFDFAYRANSRFLTDVSLFLQKSGQQNEAWIQTQLRGFQADIPRAHFKVSIRTEKSRKLAARIYEVPPHLGLYRGCIGGDCSTSMSAFFPLSPREHIFYIADERGEFVGYISVTRLKVEGVESLYIKDLMGGKLSRATAEVALQAIYNSLSLYGAKKLLIANKTFTNNNNSNTVVRNLLNEYIRAGTEKTLDFQDGPIRIFIRGEKGLADYDIPSTHPDGILLKKTDLHEIPFKFHATEGTIPGTDPAQLASEAVLAPRRVILEGQSLADAARVLSEEGLKTLVDVINNTGALSVDEYIKSLKKHFAIYGVSYNKDFRAKNLDLLSLGILRSPDLLSHAEKKWGHVGAQIFFQFLRQGLYIDDTAKFFKAWAKPLQEHVDFKSVLSELAQRLSPQDVFILFNFAEEGSKQAKAILQDVKYRPQIEVALEYFVQPDVFAKFESQDPKKGEKAVLGGLFQLLQNPDAYTVRAFEKKFAAFLRAFKMSPAELQNSRVLNEVELAVLRTSNSFKSDFKNWYRRIDQKIRGDQITGIQFLKWLEDFNVDNKATQESVKLRIEQLKKANTDAAVMEIHAIEAMGFEFAKEYLRSPELRETNLRVVKTVLKKGFGSGDYAPLSKEAFEIFRYVEEWEAEKKTNNIMITTLKNEFGWVGDSASETFDHWDLTESILGVRRNDLMDTPLIARLAGQEWLKTPDAFNSAFDEVTGLSFKYLLYVIKAGKDEPAIWKSFFANSAYLKQLLGFKPFVESLQKSFIDEKCEGCGHALVQMITEGMLDRNLLLNREANLRMLVSPFSRVRIFGFIQAVQEQAFDLISDQVLNIVTRDLSELSLEGHSFAPRILKENALAALSQTQSKDPKLLKALLNWIQYEPINLYAVRVVKIYLDAGGDPRKAKKALDEEFQRAEMNQRPSPEEKSVLAMLTERIAATRVVQVAAKKAVGDSVKSCQLMF